MLPYLTADLPGVGGVTRTRPEDFFVEELPLYEPEGEGEHVYAFIQKVGLTTHSVIRKIAQALDIDARDIGYAGLKDANAVTRQMLSIPLVDPNAVAQLQIPDVQIMWVDKHRNKLRPGHLAGNRFAIRIRGVDALDVVKLQPIVKRLQQHGMPNYFGEQRFGNRNDNHLLGAALLRGDLDELMQRMLGSPDPAVDDEAMLQARQAFAAGNVDKALELWPGSGYERRALSRLVQTDKPGQALRSVEKRVQSLWISALQSAVFNSIVARRVEQLDQVLTGDWAYKHDNGACFSVEDAAAEQPRCAAWEISPSGPMLGERTSLATHKPGEIEQAAFDEFQLTQEMFVDSKHIKAKGTRRPLRVQPADVSLQSAVESENDTGSHSITVAFTLPAGSFATSFLRELMKGDEPAS